MRKLIFTIQFIILVHFVFGQLGGSQTYSFLDLPNSAKISALGGYNVSLKDASIIFNNPAIMDSSTANMLNFSYVNYFAGINWGYSSYTFNSSKFGNFAVGLQYINYGKFIAADELGNINGEFSAADYTFSALWSIQVDSFWSVGIALKPLLSTYEIYTSYGIASDLGLNYFSRNKNFSAGLVFRNIGTQIKPYTPENYEDLPFDIQLGFSQKLAHAPFRFSVLAHHLNKPNLSYTTPKEENHLLDNQEKNNKIGNIADLGLRHMIVGVELIPSKNVYIALGFNYQRRQELKLEHIAGLSGFSAGLGLDLKKFSFNYGIAKYHLAGSSQNFTISLKINQLFFGGRKNL